MYLDHVLLPIVVRDGLYKANGTVACLKSGRRCETIDFRTDMDSNLEFIKFKFIKTI